MAAKGPGKEAPGEQAREPGAWRKKSTCVIHSGELLVSRVHDREEDERRKKNACVIHSGQFMVSRVHDREEDDREEDEEEAEIDVEGLESGAPAQSSAAAAATLVPTSTKAEDKPITFYKFGPHRTRSIAIDVSLRKLNTCINFAYERLTTPRWKFFRGIKLSWKDRLRLNNVIWRSWHMEFVGKQTPKYCCYSVPGEDTHQQKEAAVLEGMYWKRRLDAVCAQYKRWRTAALPRDKARVLRQRRPSSQKAGSLVGPRPSQDEIAPTKLRENDVQVLVPRPFHHQVSADTNSILEQDDFDNYFTDRLFDSLSQTSYMFPDPKEMNVSGHGHTKNADIIQPSLITLQPSLEDIMASLDANYDEADSFFGGGGAFSGLSQTPPPGTSHSHHSHYSQKDYQDAQLLLPQTPSTVHSAPQLPHSQLSPVYQPQAQLSHQPQLSLQPQLSHQPQLTYSQAAGGHHGPSLPWSTSSASSVSSAPQLFQLGPPNPPPPFSPTPTKGALKAYPPPSSQPPKLRGKRARQAANQTAEKPSVRQPPPFGSAEQRSPQSAFSPVSPGPQQSPLPQPPQVPLPQPSQPQPFPPLSVSLPSLQAFPPPRPGNCPQSGTSSGLSSPSSVSSYSSLAATEIKKEPGEQQAARGSCAGPKRPTKRAAADSTMDPSERKRMLHLHAEQSRRSALKTGFDQLEGILPNLPSPAKNTNAAILARASEHIAGLKTSVGREGVELDRLRTRVGELKARIATLQGALPAGLGGAPGALEGVLGTGVEGDGGLGQAYARRRTAADWRFPLLWRLLGPLRTSFWREVEGRGGAELAAQASHWAQARVALPRLRPELSALLVQLATSAPAVLSDPTLLPNALRDSFL